MTHVSIGRFNFELCADLYNRIFEIGWKGSGRSWGQLPTWWQHFQPTDAEASHYHPWMIEFLKRVYYRPDSPPTFYYVGNLSSGEFDQVACKATFVTHCEDNLDRINTGHGWKPLEDIYRAYLAMITSRKVEVQQWPSGRWKWETDTDQLCHSPIETIGPWRFHTYTPTDIQLAVAALQELLDAIEARLPPSATSFADAAATAGTSGSSTLTMLPWADPSVREEGRILPNSFAGAFCDATATTSFRYLAPGIRLPTIAEFRAQPFRDYEYVPWYLRELPRLRPIRPTLRVSLPVPARPPGLYLSGDNRDNRSWESGCHLLLPFSIGGQGWVRRSDDTILGRDYANDLSPRPGKTNSELYQCVENGCVPHRHVPIHHVLRNWAERVREGDWDVDEDGVSGGIGKWRVADTEEMWEKYRVPMEIY
ncbi:uncharacterized protein BO95DRAFT_421878 [Aspergillus brunneoviolaceus CBS 621.78]|uniref:Uncharacterized protein n=1 Tax=Aspergillus brunneoviolaceus CBS 621.78 TaxID=1450534 RepID=A0ACD1FXU5_9EURO|nr:hypothetical protein BO95DRAFT_421878 [Aspergillus brunneoviolaceus CBS 621.78]RAH41831.1 hypothetical protein BO95DRAFT_421878 [Aspergillus brunneoviolaceus CBS 621.78]